MRDVPLSTFDDAVLRTVLASAGEGKGWLDLTIVCSRTGRMLPDVRDAVHRLVRRRLLLLDDKAAHTPRWMKFVLPETPAPNVDHSPVV
jgi:hypothetical protein